MIYLDSIPNSLIPNRLLAAIPPREFARFLPKLEEVDLAIGANIYDRGDPIDHVYFPVSGALSLLAVGTDELTLEIGVVGREGMAGLSVFLGDKFSNCRAVVHGQGSALRMKASDFEIECAKSNVLRGMLLRFLHVRMIQVSLASACHRFHKIEKRFVRWILMTRDRLETNEFPVTQDFLANILGVRRETIGLAAKTLKKDGLITFDRGLISVTNRPGLEAAACKCYSIIRSEEEKLRT